MANCCLDTKLKTLGKPNCFKSFGVIKQIIFAPKDLSGVTMSSVANPTNPLLLEYYPDFQNALLDNEVVISDVIDLIEITKQDSTFKEYDSGTKYFIKSGRHEVKLEFAVPTFGQIEAFKELACRKLGVYLVNENNDILGVETIDTVTNNITLSPIPILDKSMDSIFNFATYSEVDRLNVTFMLDLFKESNLRILDEQDLLIPPVFVFVPMNYNFNSNTEHFEIDTVANEIRVPLAFVNNIYDIAYLNLSDFNQTAPNYQVRLVNQTTNAAFTFNYLLSQISYNNTTKVFTFSGVTLTGITAGTKYKLDRITNLNDTYSRTVYKDDRVSDSTNIATAQ